MSRKNVQYTVEDFYFLKVGPLWRYFWSEHPAFWFICGYLFIEYFRPQSIYPAIDILPWAQFFLLGAMVFSILDKKSRLSWSWNHTCILLFTFQIHLSMVFAYNIDWSKEYYVTFFQWILVFFLVTSILTTKERVYIFFLVFLLCSLKISFGTSVIFAARGFAFTSWGLKGPPGYFENSGELAIQMLILLSLSLHLFSSMWKRSAKLERVILMLCLVTPLLTIIGASSRGAQLAMLIVLVIFFNFKLFNIKVFFAVAILLAAMLYMLPDQQKERFETLGNDQTSELRKIYWRNGLAMIEEHPYVGVGYYNYIPYYVDYFPEDILFVNARGDRVPELPHNILIQIGTDGGIPALVFYLMFIHASLRSIHQSGGILKISKGLQLGLVGFFVAGQFVTVGYYPFLWISASIIASIKLLPKSKDMENSDRLIPAQS